MYTATITNFPPSTDPSQLIIEATISDGTNTIVRGYSLPSADEPTPSDFEALITADVDALNQASEAQTAFQAAFISDKKVTLQIDTSKQDDAKEAKTDDTANTSVN
jgi:hypothetical protein